MKMVQSATGTEGTSSGSGDRPPTATKEFADSKRHEGFSGNTEGNSFEVIAW